MYKVLITEERYMALYNKEKSFTALQTKLELETADEMLTFVAKLQQQIKDQQAELDAQQELIEKAEEENRCEHQTTCSRCDRPFRYFGPNEPRYCSRDCELGQPFVEMVPCPPHILFETEFKRLKGIGSQ